VETSASFEARSAPPPYPASCDLFRCESATLRTHWVLVVMDQFTRRIVGFGVQGGIVDGAALCGMFQRAIRGQTTPNYLSTDNDPLYRFHQWQANLRVLEVAEIKTVPYVPLSQDYASHCTSWVRCDATSLARRRCDSFTPWAFRGGLSPGCSNRQSFLSLQG
jgi:transposase InsO family protein